MRTFTPIVLTIVGLTVAGCGATTRTTSVYSPAASPALTSAAVSFVSRDHGKDKNSTLTIQLMRDNAELAAEALVVSTKFDDYSATAPLALSVRGPFSARDVDDARLRLRLTPDGRDDWTFDTHLTLRFSDGSVRNFFWSGIRLDNGNPERTLALETARVP
jgi:hypothetical protein